MGTQRFGKRVAIGVKPKRLLEKADRSLGEPEKIPVSGIVMYVFVGPLVKRFGARLVLTLLREIRDELRRLGAGGRHG